MILILLVCRKVGRGAAEGEQGSRGPGSGAEVPGQTSRRGRHAGQTFCLQGETAGCSVSCTPSSLTEETRSRSGQTLSCSDCRYEVNFQDGIDCGGAYIKLLSDDGNLNLVGLNV